MKIEIRIKDPNTTRPVTTTLAPTSSTTAVPTTLATCIILTVLVIVLIFSIRHFIMQHRKIGQTEQERLRGDSLTTDISFQTPHELFA